MAALQCLIRKQSSDVALVPWLGALVPVGNRSLDSRVQKYRSVLLV